MGTSHGRIVCCLLQTFPKEDCLKAWSLEKMNLRDITEWIAHSHAKHAGRGLSQSVHWTGMLGFRASRTQGGLTVRSLPVGRACFRVKKLVLSLSVGQILAGDP